MTENGTTYRLTRLGQGITFAGLRPFEPGGTMTRCPLCGRFARQFGYRNTYYHGGAVHIQFGTFFDLYLPPDAPVTGVLTAP
jgi:hypothetical protein